MLLLDERPPPDLALAPMEAPDLTMTMISLLLLLVMYLRLPLSPEPDLDLALVHRRGH